ncbi:putative metalloprotease CJM1_0395 family protein [Azoarcus sp. KH32C]|uniref:putative metalloprotease CJM1_0395 family protein n=1 Tax=Azoarcus sp. KH32C TaxID=748247 RepID=UPI0002386EC2|nr:putative metalloprotease CJM1_0395 family protein [Azoarcus sp. KH32C]BAL24442.1 hypothetical protein AZKH_2129 [Azoarcus sp. KH32C]
MNIGSITSAATPSLTQASIGSQRTGASATASPASASQLRAEDQRVLAQLQQSDREVRAHEMSHLAAGAGLVRGGPSYTYQRGPDGQLYAVGGEVSIDTSPGRTPEETIRRAQQVRAAALAPADPSAQDRQVAAAASHMEIEARIEAAQSTESTDTGPGAQAGRRELSLQRTLEPQQVGGLIDTYA